MNYPPLQLEAMPVVSSDRQQPVYSPSERDRRPAKRRLTREQVHYLFVSQAIGAGVIDGIINFVFASAMYRTTHKEIRMWPLEQNTIAGDLGVTVIIQGIFSTLISTALVRDSVLKKEVEPFSFPFPDVAWWQSMARSQTWKKRIGSAVSFFSPKQTLSFRYGFEHFAKSLGIIIIRGFLISGIYFFIFWPIAIAITAPLYDRKNLHGTWTPEIIKALYGAALGFFMTPFIAALVLGSQAAPKSKLPDSESHAFHSLSRSSLTMSQPPPPKNGKSLLLPGVASLAVVPKSPVIEDSSSSHARIASTTIIPISPMIADLSSLRSPTATTIISAFPVDTDSSSSQPTEVIPCSPDSLSSHAQTVSTTMDPGSPVIPDSSSSPHASVESTPIVHGSPVIADSSAQHARIQSTTTIPGSPVIADLSSSPAQLTPTSSIILTSPVIRTASATVSQISADSTR